eukprot:1150762-Pelagomonas_calceolata.AAC.2
MNKIPELERRCSVDIWDELVKRVPCSWVRRQNVLVQVHQQDSIDSHQGTKSRPPKKQQQEQPVTSTATAAEKVLARAECGGLEDRSAELGKQGQQKHR